MNETEARPRSAAYRVIVLVREIAGLIFLAWIIGAITMGLTHRTTEQSLLWPYAAYKTLNKDFK